jgi:hypothetical protein
MQQNDRWWEKVITPALPVAGQNLQVYFEGYWEFMFKLVYFSMIYRRTAKDILRNFGWEEPLHVHRTLMSFEMYYKHKQQLSVQTLRHNVP